MNEWQIGRKDEPSIRVRRFFYCCRYRVTHAWVAAVLKMPRQAAILHSLQRTLQNRFAHQSCLQFGCGSARRSETLTTPGGQNDDGGHMRSRMSLFEGVAGGRLS